MKYNFILASLSNAIYQLLSDGICSKLGGPLICCENYRKVGEACEECWPGTHSFNCTPCPPGFYGKLCRESCINCTQCHPVTGCAPTESYDENTTYNSADTSTRVHFFNQGNVWLALSVTIACSVSFTVSILICCKLRKCTSKQCQDNQESEKSSPEMQMRNSANLLTRENKPGLRLQNKYHDTNMEYGQFEDFGPYDILNLKIGKDSGKA
ncbi:uncharacterized protein LOC134247581 isoform X2 [Saccostrea cucullata]|uniref:uncharacterized protein LOC134247581 isoform X2 n=1 Tax=Saccostrea cuccullata TaxID=36930 RepID=UPI002ED579D2